MKNFISNNWFKMCVAVGLIMIGGVCILYFGYFLPKKNQADLQMKCSDAADKFSKEHPFGKTLYSQNNHWNKSLNKCFVETVTLGNDYTEYDMYDAIDNQQYASYSESGSVSANDLLILCNLYPKGNRDPFNNGTVQCKTQTDFDNFVKPFMSN